MKAAAYFISQSVAALIKALGMFAHDLQQIKHRGGAGTYTEADYEKVIDKHMLGHNSVVIGLREFLKD